MLFTPKPELRFAEAFLAGKKGCANAKTKNKRNKSREAKMSHCFMRRNELVWVSTAFKNATLVKNTRLVRRKLNK
jgi:hypothetical protein